MPLPSPQSAALTNRELASLYLAALKDIDPQLLGGRGFC